MHNLLSGIEVLVMITFVVRIRSCWIVLMWNEMSFKMTSIHFPPLYWLTVLKDGIVLLISKKSPCWWNQLHEVSFWQWKSSATSVISLFGLVVAALFVFDDVVFSFSANSWFVIALAIELSPNVNQVAIPTINTAAKINNIANFLLPLGMQLLLLTSSSFF